MHHPRARTLAFIARPPGRSGHPAGAASPPPSPTPSPVATPSATPVPAADIGAPTGTTLHFHLTQTVSSNGSKTGSTFGFVMDEPIVRDGKTLVAAGTAGTGTVVLAGPAGMRGHEGDLTLRMDSIPTVNKDQILQINQTVEINGRNIKLYSAALGFVPFVGLGASFLHGQNIAIPPDKPITTVLKQDAALAPAA